MDLIVAFAALIAFLGLGAAVSFIFFGYLAYLENYEDMPHEEDRNDQ
jgi:hypothetical protein